MLLEAALLLMLLPILAYYLGAPRDLQVEFILQRNSQTRALWEPFRRALHVRRVQVGEPSTSKRAKYKYKSQLR